MSRTPEEVLRRSWLPCSLRNLGSFIRTGLLGAALASCAGPTDEAADVSEGPVGPVADAPAEDATPRLVWISPDDGAEVSSPVHLEFDAVNYEIAAVPAGTVETAREGIAHHHVGMEGECLTPGTMVPQDNPAWIHFGDGSNFIDMQLEPGEYTLAIQAGNDLHEAVDGLCEVISFTVIAGAE